jgi:hypothetical protein
MGLKGHMQFLGVLLFVREVERGQLLRCTITTSPMIAVVDGDGWDDGRQGCFCWWCCFEPPSLLLLTSPRTVLVVAALMFVAIVGGGGGGLSNPRSLKRLSRRTTFLLRPAPAAAGSGRTRGLKRCSRVGPPLSGRPTILPWLPLGLRMFPFSPEAVRPVLWIP